MGCLASLRDTFPKAVWWWRNRVLHAGKRLEPPASRLGIRVKLGRCVFRDDHRANMHQEINSVDELHGEKPAMAVGDQIIEGHRIGVGNTGQCAELLLEAE